MGTSLVGTLYSSRSQRPRSMDLQRSEQNGRNSRLSNVVLQIGQRIKFNLWSGRRDSNPRRQAWEACILPLNYSRNLFFGIIDSLQKQAKYCCKLLMLVDTVRLMNLAKKFKFYYFLSIFLFVLPCLAETTELVSDEAQQISNSVMSPYCPGRTLASCPSPQARELRGQIAEWIKGGESPVAIVDRLRTMFGKEIIGAPESRGFGLVGWWMPAAFVVLLLLTVCLWLKRLQIPSRKINVAKINIRKQSRDLIEKELTTRMT